MLQHSASPPSPGLDHERAEDSRRANDGPLAANTPRRRGVSRRSFPTTPYGATTESARVTERVVRVYSNDRPRPRLFPYGVARHCAHQARGAQLCQPCSSVLQLRLRATRGAGNFRLHGASMRPMQRALVEF